MWKNYKNLIIQNVAKGKWEDKTGENAKPQYNYEFNDRNAMMLNTDIEVFYDLELDSDQFLATCGPPFQSCNLAPTYDIANGYADVIHVYIRAL